MARECSFHTVCKNFAPRLNLSKTAGSERNARKTAIHKKGKFLWDRTNALPKRRTNAN